MAGRGQIVFHSGALFAKNTAANSTPIRVATLQEVSFDFKASNKELFGENQFAEASREVGIAGRRVHFLSRIERAPDPVAQRLGQLEPVGRAAPHRRRHLFAAAGPVAVMVAGLALALDVGDLVGDRCVHGAAELVQTNCVAFDDREERCDP